MSEHSKLEFAQKALQILQEDAGLTIHDDDIGPDPMRYQFERAVVEDSPHGVEFRFIGSLGFGGKFHLHARHFAFPRERSLDYRCYVSTYPECRTPERDAMIERTNERLSALADEYLDVFTATEDVTR